MPNPVANVKFGIEASGSVGSIARLFGSFKMAGEAYGGSQLSASIKPFTIEASGAVGTTGVANLILPRSAFTLSATGSMDAYGRANLVAPKFISIYGVFRGTAPLFVSRGLGSQVIEKVYKAYAVNVKNAAMSEYTGFPFNHIVRFDGMTIAFADDESVVLGADKDDTAEIDAVLELAPTDFGSSLLKRVPYSYVGVKNGQNIKVTMIVDEKEYVATLTATKGRNRRAKLARGVKGRYFAARIENLNGDDFAIDSYEYLPMVLGRKV
jgi:hypothetical protein